MFKIDFVFCRYGNKQNKKYNILMHDTIDHVPSINDNVDNEGRVSGIARKKQ